MTAWLGPIPPGAWAVAAAVMTGLTVTSLARRIYQVATAARPDHLLDMIERDRRLGLRHRSRAYRWFEPIVDGLARRIRVVASAPSSPQRAPAEGPHAGPPATLPAPPAQGRRPLGPDQLQRLRRDLLLAEPVRWEPEEYLAVKQIEGVAVGLAGVVFGWLVGGPLLAIILGVSAMLASPWILAREVRHSAESYRAGVRSRLPLAIDLMALMLEAEATLPQCLDAVADENRGHPIGTEFALLSSAAERGAPRPQVLEEMARRVDDADVSEFVVTLTASGQNPALRDILRSMAGPMRNRRIQQLEKASELAKVNMTWPAVIIMVACLLIMMAVYILPAAGGNL
jgi:Flp pilus assembly protein TadB